ncbi:MAG: hypothetical protein ACOX16_04315 [Candidatus Izemoplasmatales bacterium]|jgi:vacuolar-type H+-ATPase subunit H
MPILDSILKAEAQAEKFRLEASEEVKTVMEKSKAKANKAVKELMEKAKKTEKEILQATDLRIQEAADKIRKENQAQNESIIRLAAKRKNRAVDFLMEKVIES